MSDTIPSERLYITIARERISKVLLTFLANLLLRVFANSSNVSAEAEVNAPGKCFWCAECGAEVFAFFEDRIDWVSLSWLLDCLVHFRDTEFGSTSEVRLTEDVSGRTMGSSTPISSCSRLFQEPRCVEGGRRELSFQTFKCIGGDVQGASTITIQGRHTSISSNSVVSHFHDELQPRDTKA